MNEILDKKRTVLIVDDVPNNIVILKNFLIKNGYNVLTATNGVEGIEVAKKEKPDLILLDIMMPVMDGYEACKEIRNDSEIANIPIIFITAKSQQDDILKAFEVGGNDYIIKPFFFQEVLLRINVHVENKLLREQLFEMSMTDPLTSLWNRRYFIEKSNLEFKRSLRYGRDLSFVILDIDNFKNVNDKYGHGVGDEVIKSIADNLREKIRGSDFLCRWGGEEFVILLAETKKSMAALLVERIRCELNFLSVKTDKGEIEVTISYGISGMCDLNNDDMSFDRIYELADKRLYEAKNSGKDKVVFK